MGNAKQKVFKFLSTEKWYESAVFFLRLFAGIMILTHGIPKFTNFDMMSDSFPDPLGLGSKASLTMVMLTEIVGALCIIAGFLVRPAAIVLAFAMFVATFLAFPGQGLSQHELSFVYMGIFIALFISGGGRYSLDRLIFRVR